MQKNKNLLITFGIFFFMACLHVTTEAIMISEVVYNYPYEREKNQYIEIINDSPFTIDLRSYDIYLQGHKINLTILSNDIESDDIKHKYQLNSGEVAVILPYDYLSSSMPFYFSNTIILFSSTKYLGKNGPIRKEDIATIKILSNNELIDSLEEVNGNYIGVERILSSTGTNLLETSIISPGYLRSDNRYIYFGKLLYDLPEIVEVFLYLNTNAAQIPLEILGRGEILLFKTSEGLFKGTITPNHNGEKIIAKFQDIYTSTRSLNLFLLSNFEENLVINEVCLYPSKSWASYFLSGIISESTNVSDKYIEIINLSRSNVSITNVYVHVMGPTNYYLKLSENLLPSTPGYPTNPIELSPGEYLIAKAGDVNPNSLIMLKDNHPYRGGKILSFVETKGLNLFPMNHSNYYIYENNRTISLLPDGLPVRLGGKYKNYYETPAKYNGFSTPSIIVDSEYKRVRETLKLWIITKEKEPYSEVTLKTKNSGIFRSFLITNQGFWYYREFFIDKDSDISPKEDDEITIEFNYKGQKYEKRVFVIPQDAKQIFNNPTPFLEKMIIMRGENIRILNISKGDEITILRDNYYPILKVVSDKKGIIEISTINLVRGIYLVMIKSDKGNYLSKIFIK